MGEPDCAGDAGRRIRRVGTGQPRGEVGARGKIGWCCGIFRMMWWRRGVRRLRRRWRRRIRTGQMMQALRDRGIEGNTLVWFTNDNGGRRLTSQRAVPGWEECVSRRWSVNSRGGALAGEGAGRAKGRMRAKGCHWMEWMFGRRSRWGGIGTQGEGAFAASVADGGLEVY